MPDGDDPRVTVTTFYRVVADALVSEDQARELFDACLDKPGVIHFHKLVYHTYYVDEKGEVTGERLENGGRVHECAEETYIDYFDAYKGVRGTP